MPRDKFKTLTEPMFYILLCLNEECCGTEIMGKIASLTNDRVTIGPGTLYHLLDQFLSAEMIKETHTEGRKRSYVLTDKGSDMLQAEYNRLCKVAYDYLKCIGVKRE